MDQQKLRNLVFEKTGVKVDSNDPIFALVALNEAVLAETVERHLALIDAATRELTALAHTHSGAPRGATPAAVAATAAAGEQPQPALAAPASAADAVPPPYVPAPVTPFAKPIPTQGRRLFAPRELRLLGAAAGLSLLSAMVVLAGQGLFAKAPAPASPSLQVASAPPPAALTPAQTAAISDGEKLARAVQKLDPKSRALIQAEMQKP